MSECDSAAAHDGSHDEHGHGHDTSSTSSRKLAVVAIIDLGDEADEVAGGLLFGSVASLSDAFHTPFDALASVIVFAASSVAERYGEGDRDTHLDTHAH